eukprot:COSAG01_NODE_7245_length_3285_cov_2.517891_1_plen_168_part_00
MHVWLCIAGYFLSVHGAPPTNRLAKSVPVDPETSLTSIVDKSLPVIDSSAEGLCQPTTSTYSWSVSFYRDPNPHSNQLGWPTYLSHTAGRVVDRWNGCPHRLATASTGCLNYHVEHHDFPAIPWFRLPRVRQLAPEFYSELRSWDGFYHTIAAYLREDGGGWRYACR